MRRRDLLLSLATAPVLLTQSPLKAQPGTMRVTSLARTVPLKYRALQTTTRPSAPSR